jgi:superfamily II DNA helicase RecQ
MGHKLQSFTVDELHLFTKFGMHFRSEFLALKPLVFNRLKDTATTTYCPVLVMTATCTKLVVNQFEQMTGITFPNPTIYSGQIRLECKDVLPLYVSMCTNYARSEDVECANTTEKSVCGTL